MPLKTHLDEAPTLNLTPMIDVLFLLIIFFMVGTKFTDDESKIRLQVPSVAQTASSSPMPLKKVVHVFQNGKILLDEKPVSLNQLQTQLKTARASQPAISVAVRGEANGTFQNVASVLNACKAAGVRNMAISVRNGTVSR